MLRCPPSRITLNSSDIADFEQRYAARQSTRLRKGKEPRVRLSPGPAHSTKLSVVPAEQNAGRRRAASSSSQATIHTNDDPNSEHEASSPSTDPIPSEDLTDNHPDQRSKGDNPFDRLLPPRPNVLATTPRRQVDSFYGTDHVIDFHALKDEPAGNTPSLTGTEPPTSQTQAHCIPWTPRGNEVLGEIRSDAYPVSRQLQTEPPLLASARARRRQTRSEESAIYQEPHEIQELTMRLYNVEPFSHRSNTTAFAVPELVLPVEDSLHANTGTLDPGAPIFMPRTRFGTATSSSGDTSNANLNIASNSSDLQLRSSSEQNGEFPGRHPPSHNDVGLALSSNEQPPPARQRRRSQTADQNIALPHMTPALDRYPIMRPVHSSGDRQRSITHQSTQSLAYGQQSNRLMLSYTEPEGALLHVENVSAARDAPPASVDHARSIFPSFSTSRLSTPNLLEHPPSTYRFSVRTSSLPWNRIGSRTPSVDRIPSMVSAASGISRSPHASRQSSREALDAAAECLRMRNSPLDDLTEQFSRMSTNRPRSVGRSWERPPRPRPSLLTGNPFQPELSYGMVPDTPIIAMQAATPATQLRTSEGPAGTAEEVVALAMALPPSSPVCSSSIALPSTPSLHFNETRSPPSPLPSDAITRSPGSTIKRKPVPAPATTPKVPVYDDTKPPNAQPQTPADVRGSKRRAKQRSDTTVLQPLVFVRQAMPSSPPSIPERHPHRNTYPPTNPAQNNFSATVSTTSFSATMTTPVQGTSRQNRTSRRARAQRSSEQAENDVEAHLQGLDEDRRTWFSRREGGDLDVTPPREGRFERYLS